MIKNLLIIIAIALATAGLTIYFDNTSPGISAPVASGQPTQQGEEAPDFTLTDIHGKTHKLTDFRGKKVILNFWASWCPPCVKEFPDLLAVAASDPDGIILLALSSDFEKEPMDRFLKKLERQNPERFKGRNVIIALDKDATITQNIFQTHLLPETILIDEKGIMRHKISGANWEQGDMFGWLNDL